MNKLADDGWPSQFSKNIPKLTFFFENFSIHEDFKEQKPYSTTPSGNLVDGLPLDLNNTDAVG